MLLAEEVGHDGLVKFQMDWMHMLNYHQDNEEVWNQQSGKLHKFTNKSDWNARQHSKLYYIFI